MSLQSKLGQVGQILKDHFLASELPDRSAEIVEALKTAGATTEASLEYVTQADIEKYDVPALLARRIVRVLGGTPGGDGNKQVIVMDDNPVNLALRLKPAELIAEYDPEQPDNPFGARLKELSKSQPFLVFNEDGSVNLPVSTKMLQELRDNYPARTKGVMVDGKVRQLYVVGDRPARFAEMHPLYHDQMLRPDGMSLGNFEWGAIPFNVRQVLFCSVKEQESGSNQPEAFIYDQVRGKTFEEVGQRFPKGYLKFQELEAGNQLPQLTIRLAPPAPK